MDAMLIRRIYDEKLAQASWLVGCAATGEALVVDPNRDVAQYQALAEREGLRIAHVTETHIHADFVSGLRELAERTGAQAYLSGEGGRDWSYGFAAELGARLVRDGDEFAVGNIRVQVLHTPGHTPEHICFLVTDRAGADRPMGLFTGDFVFVGDVGRPDLLEKAAGEAGTTEAAARALYASLQRLEPLPDWLQLWPGHGAGSACGKALGAVPQSTLGYERLFNWGLAAESEAAFVAGVLAGQPEPPRYFAVMKRVNRDGPARLDGFPRPPRLDPMTLRERREDAVVVDARPWPEFAAGHAAGTLNIPLNRSFPNWAGSLLPYDRDILLLLPAAAALPEAVRDLAMIGLDRVAGWFAPDALAHAGPLRQLDGVGVQQARTLLERGGVAVLDVRGQSEWDEVHLPADAGAGVHHIPLGALAERMAELPDATLLVHCKSGSRSAIATSLLAAHGRGAVLNLEGGIDAWIAEGGAVERA